jgi:putative DNA primase/helicase
MIERVSEQDIRDMLAVIPSDDRDLWWKLGMAVKSELGDEGEAVFTEWSARGEGFNVDDVKASWKSFKTTGNGIKIGTLFYEAKAHGYDSKARQTLAPLTKAQAAKIKKAREEQERADAAQLDEHQRAAAVAVARLWDTALPAGASAYLAKKGVHGHGVRYSGKNLLVPMVDKSGALWNVQRIFSNGDKRFQVDGRVTGCFHLIGTVDPTAWLLVAEGYATAATLHEATGLPVAMAFNSNNLRHVTLALHALYPDVHVLVCGDDDAATAEKIGKNPGRVAAQMAAAAINGITCFPSGLPVGKTDFNDLADASGVEAVRQQVVDAMSQSVWGRVISRPIGQSTSQLHGTITETMAVESTPKKADSTGTKKRGSGERPDPGASKKEKKGGVFFNPNEDGVWFHGVDQRGEPLNPLWVCSELYVTAHSRDSGNSDWGYLLEFGDPDGNSKQLVLPATMLAGDGVQYRSLLLGMGLRIGASATAKNQLTVYIQTAKTDARVRCTDKIGWHDDVYVMPNRTIGEKPDGEKVVFQSAAGSDSQFKQRGTLEEWKREVAAHCRGNSRLLLCVSAAFASTLLPIAQVPSGGFHVHGPSSSGKSTAIKAAGSVFGGRDYPRNWRLTDNSLEQIAMKYSDALLILDEIAQVDPKVVGDTVYMLANESGKGRLTQTAVAKKVSSWRSMFLSDGEIDLATHMAAAGKGKKAGHDVRMAHVPADAGKGLGIYETLHDFSSGAELSDHLVAAAKNLHGTAGIAFIEHAAENFDYLCGLLPGEVMARAREMCPHESVGQVARVAMRFALVGIGGELATAAGITGWDAGEAADAARSCFAIWLSARGGAGDTEHTAILRQVSAFFQLHGGSRFVSWHRATDDHAPNVINRAGYRRMLTGEGAAINSHIDHHASYGDRMHPADADAAEYEYFVFTEVFKAELCKGFDPKLVARLLIERGLLVPETGERASAQRQERLPGLGKTRVYRFKPGIISMEM